MKQLVFLFLSIFSLNLFAFPVSMRANQFTPLICDYTLSMYGEGTNVVDATGISTITVVDDDDVSGVYTNALDTMRAAIIDVSQAQTVFVHALDGNPLYFSKDPNTTKVFLAHADQINTNIITITQGQVLRVDRVSPGNYLYSIIYPVTQSVVNVTSPTNSLNSLFQ